MEVPEVEARRPPHRPRRTRRACRGRPLLGGRRRRSRPVGRSKNEIVADIRAQLSVLPVATNIGQPISHRLDHMLSGVRAQIALKVFGEDLDTIRSLAEEFREKLAGVPGIVDLQVERQVRIPQLDVIVDYRRAALYGLTPAAVTEQLERLSNGRIVSRLVDGNRRFDVVLRLQQERRDHPGAGRPADRRRRPAGSRCVRSPTSSKPTAPTRSCARTASGASWCSPIPMARPTWRPIVAEIRRIVGATPLPTGFFTSLEGTFQAQEESMRTIGLLSLVSLAMIFVILYSRYRSLLFVAHHHGQRAARPDRQRGGTVAGRPAAVGRLDGRLHHAHRHRDPQRHPEDQPLHQPGDRRGHAFRTRPRRARQPGAADAGAHDGAVGGGGAGAADDRRRRRRARRSCIPSPSRSSADS